MMLRVLGRQDAFALYSAIFYIGSGESNDIVLDHAKPDHLKIAFAGESLILMEARGPIWLDGKPVASFPQDVAVGQLISIDESTHLFYGPPGAPEPVAPTIVIAKEEAKKPLIPPLAIKLIAVFLASFALYFTLTAVLKHSFTRYEASVEVREIRPVDVHKFIEEVLGDDLLSIEETTAGFTVRALNNPNRAQQEADLAPVQHWRQITVQWIDLKDLLFHVKRSLDSSKLSVSQDRTTFTITGICVSTQCGAVDNAIARAASLVPDALLVNKVTRIYPDFEIMSVSVSNRAASATLRRHGQTVVVPEGGKVYSLGTLRLIAQNGITVATAQGDIFIGFTK